MLCSEPEESPAVATVGSREQRRAGAELTAINSKEQSNNSFEPDAKTRKKSCGSKKYQS